MKFLWCWGILLINTLALAGTMAVLSIDDAVQMARSHSRLSAAANEQLRAAESMVEAAQTGLYPKLTLEGTYRHQSVVPEVVMGTKITKLTDEYGYSIGPTLSYVLWDSSLTRHRLRNLESIAHTKDAQRQLSEKQVELMAELAYLNCILAGENLAIARQAEQLARVQNKDIQVRYKNGAVSRIDSLNSDSEVLNHALKVEQAENELRLNRSDLAYQLGRTIDSQTLLYSLTEIFQKYRNVEVSARSPSSLHPLLLIHEGLEKASLAQVEMQHAAYWPTVSLQFRSSLDYPNGPKFEQIHQNMFGLSFSWSLYEFGNTKYQVSAKNAELKAVQFQREEVQESLKRDLEKIGNKIVSLYKQVGEAEQIVNRQEELARLNYSAYRFGKMSFSDVQNANLRLLEAKNRLASMRAQYLNQFFNYQYLAERD